MTDGSAWRGNWRVRLYERVRERGYDSLTAFAEARPTASLVALAEELGKDEVAGAQVFGVLLATPPPPGWRPLGPDDELLRTLLPDEEV